MRPAKRSRAGPIRDRARHVAPTSAASGSVSTPVGVEVSLERAGDLCRARVATAAVPETDRSEIMSGYFLRIARQAGARIAGDSGQRAGTPTAKTEFAPIDQAETIMVPPQASSDVTAPRRLGPNVAAPVQDQTRGQSMPERSTSAIDPATEKSP